MGEREPQCEGMAMATSAFQFLQSEQNGVTDISSIIGVIEVLDDALTRHASIVTSQA